MPITPKSFLYELDPETHVATVTLNRPDRLNALTFEVYTELGATFRALDTEANVRAIVITGSGKGFCSGGDVEDIIGQLFARDHQGLLEFTRLTGELVVAMRKCRRPIVAALNGTVAGAGAVIATAADVRIGAQNARIAYLFTKVGLSGADMGMCWLLPRVVGFGRASELLMTGDFISAEEALRIGLYNRVVPTDGVLMEAQAFAARLARGPGYGLEVTKALLNREASMEFMAAIDLEAEAQAACMLHPDFREAYEAFRNKRAPNFR
ncbi:MAG: enoyl-CoA hydratase family protein [Myxococcales bacterium]|nr:enoyl-CoA hydratase family protein [Myxococcales bacterium]